MKASEPIVAYNTPELQRLKDSLIATIDASTDVSKLEQCWALFHAEELPCMYSEEEFDWLIEAAENEGYATQKEVNTLFVIALRATRMKQ